ncbi:MAG: Amino acid/amide transporter ATP-binding protein 2, family [Pseudarthrobacter sp.]|nr:Amino acid/amide transporter ATP-binding protein 2, family [Pseudarthrobacter sp.]
MLSAQQLHVRGRRDPLLPTTSLEVRRGELVLVSGERQDHRTALALVLSARMKTTSGSVSWDGNRGLRRVRMASALVDAPGVNEPERHLSVRDLVTEDLALIPRRYRGALLSNPWLKVNSFEDIADQWIEQLDPLRRLELLTALALANPHTDLLVVDSPDRHTADAANWLPRLEQLSADAGRPLAVVATVAALPPSWAGSFATIGNAEAPVAALREETGAPAEAPSETREAPEGPAEVRDIEFETEDAK